MNEEQVEELESLEYLFMNNELQDEGEGKLLITVELSEEKSTKLRINLTPEYPASPPDILLPDHTLSEVVKERALTELRAKADELLDSPMIFMLYQELIDNA